jgi:hypothetical protein
MHSQLAQLTGEYEHAQRRLEKLVDGVSADRWPVRSDPDRWSVSECIAHLNLTSEAYIPRMQKAISEAKQLPAMTRAKYRRDLKGWLLAKMVGPLPRIGGKRIGRVSTTAAFVPTSTDAPGVLVATFAKHQLELLRMLGESNGLQIDKVSIVSPFGEKVRYDCYSAFTILPRHQERHLQQAELVWASER